MAVVRNEESQVQASLSLREKLQEQIAQSMKAIEPETQTSNLRWHTTEKKQVF